MSTKVRAYDVGTVIGVRFVDNSGAVVDISTASPKKMIIHWPDKTKTIETGSFYTDGTDGILTYTTLSSDPVVTGRLAWQGYATIGTWTGTTEEVEVEIEEVIKRVT